MSVPWDPNPFQLVGQPRCNPQRLRPYACTDDGKSSIPFWTNLESTLHFLHAFHMARKQCWDAHSLLQIRQ